MNLVNLMFIHHRHNFVSAVVDLQNMYRLLCPIHSGLGVLIQEVEDHIREIGLSAVKCLKGDNVSIADNLL